MAETLGIASVTNQLDAVAAAHALGVPPLTIRPRRQNTPPDARRKLQFQAMLLIPHQVARFDVLESCITSACFFDVFVVVVLLLLLLLLLLM